MGKVCTSCGGSVAIPKLPPEEPEKCVDCDESEAESEQNDSES